jgi:asparagine synthase (glutamine-hydrolysing)
VPEPFTFHRAIRALPAGTTMRIDAAGAREPAQYFSINEEFRKAEAAPRTLGAAAADDEIRAICADSMRYHMVSDVPVGIFLSAGVDSSVLATLGARQSRDTLHAITLGFREYRGTPTTRRCSPRSTRRSSGSGRRRVGSTRATFRDQWRSFFAGMDQPSTDGVNSYLVSHAAAASGLKVAISGLGGDELFGGYPSFRDIPRMRRLVPRAPRLGKLLRASSAPLLGRVTSPKYCGAARIRLDPRRRVSSAPRAVHAVGASTPDGTRARCRPRSQTLQPLARLDESVAGLTNDRCIVSALEFRGTCATSCCAMPIGPGWRTASRSASRSST